VANENNNPNITQQPVEGQGRTREHISLTRGDILSDDALHLPVVPQQAGSSESGNLILAPDAVLQVDELLSSIESHPSLGGGFLTFDSDSSPGHTIVRVMLDDGGAQQAFDVGIFNGVGMDLNSLLGPVSSHDGDHS
jgi:hypothetical protein